MSVEDQIRAALDHAGATLARHLEANVRAIADQVSGVVAAECQTAVEAATEQAASRARATADAHLAELRALAQHHADDLERAEHARVGAVARAHVDRDQADMARAARLADSVRVLDASRSLSEVLERLTQRAGLEVARAALFLVKDDHLTGWRFVGFDPSAPAPTSVVLAPDAAGVAGAAFERGVAVSGRGDWTGDPRPAFLRDGDARVALALPVRVGGEVVAVLYADDPERAPGAPYAPWLPALDVLAHYASRVLEAMTVQQFTGLLADQPAFAENAR